MNSIYTIKDELFSIENNKEVYYGCENLDETLESEVIVNG